DHDLGGGLRYGAGHLLGERRRLAGGVWTGREDADRGGHGVGHVLVGGGDGEGSGAVGGGRGPLPAIHLFTRRPSASVGTVGRRREALGRGDGEGAGHP